MARARSLRFARRLFWPSLGMRRSPIPCCQCQSRARQSQRYFCLEHSGPSKIKCRAQASDHGSTPIPKISSLVFCHLNHFASAAGPCDVLLPLGSVSSLAGSDPCCRAHEAFFASSPRASSKRQKQQTSSNNQALRAQRQRCRLCPVRRVPWGRDLPLRTCPRLRLGSST